MNLLTTRLALTVILSLGSLGSTSHAQADDPVAKQFTGMWRLASRTQRLADGTTRQHPISVGYIIYTDSGHMCYVAMNPSRAKWKSETAPTAEEAISGITGLGAYCATVEVYSKEGFVVHQAEIDKIPNLVDRAKKRWFTFQGPNRVVLRVDTPELILPVVEDTLTWDRVRQ